MLSDDHVGEEAEVLRGARGLPLRLRDRQPGVERLQAGDLVRARLDRVGDLAEDLRPRPRGHPRPRTRLERRRRRLDRPVHVLAARRHLRVHAVGHRVRDPEGRPVHARHLLPADEVEDLLRCHDSPPATRATGPSSTGAPWRSSSRTRRCPGPVSGTSGGLTKFEPMRPACASTHLAAAGLVSVKMTSVTGCRAKCRSRALSKSPAVQCSYIRATAPGARFAVALTKPAPPSASSGRQSSSIPDQTRVSRPAACSTREKCSKSLVVSLTPTMLSCAFRSRATVSGAMSTAVRDGTL